MQWKSCVFQKYNIPLHNLKGVENGVEFDGDRLKILLAYAINGYPLVDEETHEGYTGLAKNTDGPMRLIVESVQGASVKKGNKVVVTLSGDDKIS